MVMAENQIEIIPPHGALIAHRGANLITRADLADLPLPEATRTHKPVAHAQIVNALLETLSFRHIQVVRDEYAVSEDGMKMFGVLDLDYQYHDVRFSIGIRNANDKSMRLAMVIGYRVFVCDNMAFQGDFQPVFAKHSSRLDLIDTVSVGVDKMQRNFDPLKNQLGKWKTHELSDVDAKMILYQAFIEGQLEVPNVIKDVHQLYFEPQYDDFRPRNLWSLSNAFTSAFKELRPFQQFKSTAKLSPFLETFAT